jgi:hypothetical protein
VAQTVTVTGVDDAQVDGAVTYTIVTAATSGDPSYQGIACRRHGEQHRQRRGRGHGHADVGPDDDRGGRDGDVHGGAQHAADGGRDDCADSSDTTEGTVASGEPDVYAANWNARRR